MTDTPINQMVSAYEVARILGINRQTLYRWVNLGVLQGFRAGGHGHWKMRWGDLLEYIENARE